MAAVAVLRSHDVIRNPRCYHETLTPVTSKPRRDPNLQISPNPNHNGAGKARRRKRSPVKAKNERSMDQALVVRSPDAVAKDLLMGQVKILKRGEPLGLASAKNKGDGDVRVGLGLDSDSGSGSGSEMVRNEIRVDGDLDLGLTGRLRPDLETAENKIRFDGVGSGLDSGSGSEMVKSEVRVDVDSDLGLTGRLGPDPETVKNEVWLDGIYAGSGVVSPPPSSLPFPGFLVRNGAATSDLRRLLRLV